MLKTAKTRLIQRLKKEVNILDQEIVEKIIPKPPILKTATRTALRSI